MVPPKWKPNRHINNLLSSLEYVPKLMVAALCIIAHLHRHSLREPSVLNQACLQWPCHLASLEAGINEIESSTYNSVIEILKSKMGREDLNMTTVKDWLPGVDTGVQVSDCYLICSDTYYL